MSPRRNGVLAILAALTLVMAACGPAEEESPEATAGAPDATDGAVSTPVGSPDGSPAGVEASGELFAFGFGYETGDVIAQTRVDYAREQYPDLEITSASA